jgi:hypothetical protein
VGQPSRATYHVNIQTYEAQSAVSDDLLIVPFCTQDRPNLWGYRNRLTGQIVVGQRFASADLFRAGRATVCEDKARQVCYAIDRNGGRTR